MTGLRTILEGLDGQGYPAYKSLSGKCYSLDTLNINFRHIQGDPFASPSRIQVDLPSQYAKLPRFALHSSDARRASADFLHRALIKSLGTKRDRSGSGKSGLIEITPVGQELLSRTALDVDPHGKVVLRLSIGLPASGRRILGRQAAQLIVNTLPQLIQRGHRFFEYRSRTIEAARSCPRRSNRPSGPTERAWLDRLFGTGESTCKAERRG